MLDRPLMLAGPDESTEADGMRTTFEGSSRLRQAGGAAVRAMGSKETTGPAEEMRVGGTVNGECAVVAAVDRVPGWLPCLAN